MPSYREQLAKCKAKRYPPRIEAKSAEFRGHADYIVKAFKQLGLVEVVVEPGSVEREVAFETKCPHCGHAGMIDVRYFELHNPFFSSRRCLIACPVCRFGVEC